MLPHLEKPRITEIQVRMDCNGCVQKIRKALYGINGIYDIYIDFPQQKLTVVGWADQEKIMKAIKKTRKIATICSHPESGEAAAAESEPPAPTPPTDGPPNTSAPEAGNPPPPADNPPPAEAAAPPAAEPAQEQPQPPPPPPPPPPPSPAPPPENPAPEVAPSAIAIDATASIPSGAPEPPKDVEEIHIIDHHAHEYRYSTNYHGNHGFRHETPPHYVSYSYKPAVYVPEYGYAPSPSRNSRYNRVEHYGDDYHGRVGGNSNITSMFSDENPNACSIS